MRKTFVRERHFRGGGQLRDIILGGQDGIVNVLGVVLGVASATSNALIVLVASLAATFAETISMAAVAYTSTKAERDLYVAERAKETEEIRVIPMMERKEIRDIYYKKGFRGRLLDQVVDKIVSNKRVWTDTMMVEELHMAPISGARPLYSFLTVFVATMIGSLIPVVPFFIMPVANAMVWTVALSTVALLFLGLIKGKLTDKLISSGLESVLIGIAAAFIGYEIGHILSIIFTTV